MSWETANAILDGLGAHCVVCPGSRNGPLLLAIQARASHTLVIDERSAGFHALGHARMGRPTVVVTTSGTAVANLLPAVVEAHQSDVPLVVLTADRPASMRDRGTNQTILQPGIFGRYVRGEADLPTDASPTDAQAAAGDAMRMASEAHGPFHLNVQFAKPLEPDGAPAPEAHPLPAATPPMPADLGQVRVGASPYRLRGRGLVVAGPLSPDVVQFATGSGAPLYADCLSGQRLPDAPLCGIPERPDWVVQVGRLPTSKALQDALAAWGRDGTTRVRVDCTGRGWDGIDAPAEMIVLEPGATLHLDARSEPWDTPPFAPAKPTPEQGVVRQLAQTLGAGQSLFVGNSLPIRHAEAFLPPSDVRIIANRGASGIDGQIATAAACDAAIIGDVSFQHDVGSLALWPQGKRLVVINNGGGRIFDQLPVAKVAPDMRLFRSPPQVDIGKAAAAFGLSHARIAAGAPLPDADVVEVLAQDS